LVLTSSTSCVHNVDRVNIERRFAQMSSLNRIATEVKKGWSDSAPLTATTFVMLVAFVASVAGILLDGRLITGVPAWLKPAKFAISTAIFSGTMAWLY